MTQPKKDKKISRPYEAPTIKEFIPFENHVLACNQNAESQLEGCKPFGGVS